MIDADLIKLVMDGMGWNKKKSLLWFVIPNAFLGGLSPEAYLWLKGKRRLKKLIKERLSENG